MLATVHEYQRAGHFLNNELKKRLDYLTRQIPTQIIMEEWLSKEPSFAAGYAPGIGMKWENVGTPDEEPYRTFDGLISYPGYGGSLTHDPTAPSLNEYGPYEAQQNREARMVENIQLAMTDYQTGLFIMGIAHLHSLFGKLRSCRFDVLAFHWLELAASPSTQGH